MAKFRAEKAEFQQSEDMAMKGNHWDYTENRPDVTLKKFLWEKIESVRRRIFESTGVEVEPIYYCAGYTDDDGTQRKTYNLAKLLYYILQMVDGKKVFAFAGNINEDEKMFEFNDEEENYGEHIAESFGDIFFHCVDDGAKKGGLAGGMIAGFPACLLVWLLTACLVVLWACSKGLQVNSKIMPPCVLTPFWRQFDWIIKTNR